MATKIRKAMRPVVGELVDAIVARLEHEAEQLVESALSAAVLAISAGAVPARTEAGSESESEETTLPPPAHRAPRPQAAERVDTAATTKGSPRQRSVMRCRKCGAEGYRSDGCGSTHNVQSAPEDEDDEDGRPPSAPIRPVASTSGPDRFAAIEARARARRGGSR